MNVHFISLGCDKNLVDSEYMLGIITDGGHAIVTEADEADVVVVNTCSFIKDATKESVETVLKMAALKKDGRLKGLVVAGCMAERYRREILNEIPEADAVVGVKNASSIGNVVERILNGEKNIAVFESGDGQPDFKKRVLSTPHYAYLKIAEGCDNRCTYCVIPKLRGGYVSRPMDDLAEEAGMLAERGVRELILVAQDTAMYGTDICGRSRLHELIYKLSEIEKIEWIRVLYAYPEHIADGLIDEIAGNPKVCKYIDMPVQHGDDNVLKRMGRRMSRADVESKINKLRDKIPGVCIRSTVMTGFPGESETEFCNLKKFLLNARFERLGVFAYSREEGTPAYKLPDQINSKEKKRRRDECLVLQQKISTQIMRGFVGQTLRVVTDGAASGEYQYRGRGYMDSPGVDGAVFFKSERGLKTGMTADVKITRSSAYDLYGAAVEPTIRK